MIQQQGLLLSTICLNDKHLKTKDNRNLLEFCLLLTDRHVIKMQRVPFSKKHQVGCCEKLCLHRLNICPLEGTVISKCWTDAPPFAKLLY